MLVVATTFGLAACSDTAVAPATETAPALAALPRPSSLSASISLGNGITLISSNTTHGVTRTLIKVDPRVNVTFGGSSEMVSIPANSICKPGVSGYGPTYWNAPCTTATTPITFAVDSWRDASGRPRVEFTPDVRFSPSKMVGLYLKDPQAAAATSSVAITWCTAGKVGCIDESITDQSLVTQRDRASGYLFRRVKHFSGYMVSVGLTDGETTETDPNYP